MGSHTEQQKSYTSLHELSLYLAERDKLPESRGKNGVQENDVSLSICPLEKCPFSCWLQKEPMQIILTRLKIVFVIIPVSNTTSKPPFRKISLQVSR